MGQQFNRDRILVVDDFSDMAMSIKRMLRELGEENVKLAHSGEQAIKALKEERYDIILCDYNLGEGRDGQQVLEEGRVTGLVHPAAVFIMITAETTIPYVLGAIEYLPDDYLTKPFTKEMLLTRLSRAQARAAELAEARDLIVKEEHEAAIKLCQAQLAAKTQYMPDFARILGELYFSTGQADKAVAFYQKVMGRMQFHWAQFGLGKALFLTGDHEAAANVLSELIQKNPLYVDAYDWLSRAAQAKGDAKLAQQHLAEAVRISPKSVQRQLALGDVAQANDDLDVAHRAFLSAIRHGEHSVRRSAAEFVKLANVQVAQQKSLKALETLQKARKALSDRPDDVVQVMSSTAAVLRDENRPEDARKALAQAEKVYRKGANRVRPDTALGLAVQAVQLGDDELGAEVMQEVVGNNHDDEAFMQRVQQVGEEAGVDLTKMLDGTIEKIRGINQQGISLFNQGKLEDAQALFEKAAEGLPNNKSFNLNAAQVMLQWMDENGRDESRIFKVRSYLDRVRMTAPDDPRYNELRRRFDAYQKAK